MAGYKVRAFCAQGPQLTPHICMPYWVSLRACVCLMLPSQLFWDRILCGRVAEAGHQPANEKIERSGAVLF